MEDEVSYSTVVFNRINDAEPEAKEPVEEVVYSEVTRNKEALSQSVLESAGESSSALLEESAMSHTDSYRRATACLGLLCVLLLAGVVGMSVMNIIQVTQYGAIMALYTNESTAHCKVQAEKVVLEKEKEELTVQRDQFNNTLRFITQFPSFPVQDFCQLNNGEIHCDPCRKDWVQNGSSCYLFCRTWKTWTWSQEYCKDLGGNLVTIDNIEEQEFIMQQTAHDEHHGYWIGLHKNNGTWVWTTGSTLEKGFWIDPPEKTDDSCASSKATSNAQKSWTANYCEAYNKCICEMRALEWPR